LGGALECEVSDEDGGVARTRGEARVRRAYVKLRNPPDREMI